MRFCARSLSRTQWCASSAGNKEKLMAIDEIVGDSIDRAVNIERRFRAGLPRGVTYPLYEAARKKQKKPLTWLAAKLLKDKVKAGQHVFVVTGAGTPPGLPAGETDGPPGAAAIARAIEFGLAAKPILISQPRNIPPLINPTAPPRLPLLHQPP